MATVTQTETQAEQKNDSEIIVGNSVILMGRRLLLWVFTGILALVLPRYLGDVGLGQLAFAESFAALFTTVLSLGMNHYIIKEVARDNTKIGSFMGASIALRLASTVIVVVAVFAVVGLTGRVGDAKNVMYLAAATLIALSFVQLATAYFNGLEDVRTPATADVIGRAVVVTAGVTVLLMGYGVVAYAIVLVVGSLINLALVTTALSRQMPLSLRFKTEQVKSLVVGGAPFILMSVLLDIYGHTDTIVLRMFTDDAVTGWFAAANRIYKTIDMLPLAFAFAILPTLSRVHKDSADSSVGMAKKVIAVGTLGIVPLAVGISLFAGQIITTLPYPEEFQNTVPLLTILALTIPFTAFLVILGSIAIAVDRQKAWAYGLLFTVVINIVFNVLAAPYFQDHYGNGGIGVAITTLVSEALMVGIGIYIMPKGVLDRTLGITVLKVFFASAVMAVAVLAGRSIGLFDPVLVIGGGIVYLLTALATRAITKEDVTFLKEMAKKKAGRSG